MGITNVSLRLVAPIDATNGAVYYNAATRNASNTDVYTTLNADASTSPIAFTVPKTGMYRISGVLGSVAGATWQLTVTDGNRTHTLSQSASGLHDGYGPSAESVVYADGFGDLYLEEGKSYTMTLKSANQQSRVYGLLVTDANRDAATSYEYFPKDNEAAADSLLSDGETLEVTTTGHSFSVTVDRAGVYGIKMKYNAKDKRVGYVNIVNASINTRKAVGRINASLAPYDTSISDYAVADAQKNGVYYPDDDASATEACYGGYFVYLYLKEGKNNLTINTTADGSGTSTFGLYAMRFDLVDAIEPADRILYNAFTYGEGTTYTGGNYAFASAGITATSISATLTVDAAGIYNLDGLFTLGPATKLHAVITDEGGETVADQTFNWTNGTYVFGTSYSEGRRYGNLLTDVTLSSGSYTLTLTREGSSWYAGVNEVYLQKTADLPEAIDTPVVTVDNNGVASWAAVDGATAYAYKVNGGDVQTTSETSVTLSNIGDTVTVMAIGNDKNDLDSAWSDVVTYHVTEFSIDLDDTASYTAVGLTKQTEGTYANYYLLTAAGSTNYIEFKLTASAAGVYAISFDAMVASGSSARVYIKNMTSKGDGWNSHATTAQISSGKTTVLGTTAANQYLYAGENTLRMYLETGRAPIYFKSIRLNLYWEDVSDAKQVISDSVVSNKVQSSYKQTGIDTLTVMGTGALMLRSGSTTTPDTFADVALPRLSEAGDYMLYVLGSAYQTAAKATVSCNGTTLYYQPDLNNAYNGSNHYGEGNLYEVGTLSLLPDTDYKLTVGASNMWLGIHAIFLVKTGEYSGEKVTLDTPVVTVDANGVASWEAVPGASGYEYVIGSGDPVVTTDTSVTLTTGQSITVKALGEGAYEDSASSESVTYTPAPATEWEYDLANTALYTAVNVSYADGYVYLPAGTANYIEFTVNAAKAGFYDISYIGKAVDRARIHHVNVTNKGDGWSGHATSAQFAAGTTQSSYTRATSQYLYEGENTVRIYILQNSYYVSNVKIALVMEDTANTAHTVVSTSNTTVVTQGTDNDTGWSKPDGNGTNGAMWGRTGAVIDVTLPSLSESGEYTLYVLGASYGGKTTFALSDGTATLSRTPTNSNHYHEGNLYEIGSMVLLADTDYTLTVTVGASWFGFHRIVLVKTGDIPNSLRVPSLSLDPANGGVSANVMLMGADYSYVTMGAYTADGELIRAVYGSKTAEAELLSMSISLSESEVASFASVRIFPTETENSTTPISEDSVYEYMLENDLTATAYTADKETGEFSVTFNFTSFTHKYVTLLLTDGSGATLGKAHTTLADYRANGTTLSVSLDPSVAANVTEMRVFATTAEGGTTAVSGMTEFAYRFAGDLRILFVSDLHYTPTFGTQSNSLNGLATEMRPQHFVDAILKENAENGVDAVFFLGDLTSSESYYRYFKEGHASKSNSSSYDFDGDGDVDMDDYLGSTYDGISTLNDLYLSQLETAGIPVYCVPGNHDTVDNAYWEKIFGYKATFGYSETEYIVRFPEQKTAVIMLNTFDEAKGAQTIDRTNDGVAQSYLGGNQQTLGYTPVEEALLFSFLDELTAEGYESVYIASHFFQSDAALVNAAKTYPIIKAFIQGDVHNDYQNSSIGDVPFFSDGHYSQSLMEYKGDNGERIFDIQRLPFSFITLEKRGSVEQLDFHKTEMVYYGKDNYDFMAKYFVLTEVAAKGENTMILTRITNTSVADGQTTNTIHAGYYTYTIREDLSDAERAIAERIAYLIETYEMNIFDSRYTTSYDTIPEGMADATETWYVNASGSFVLTGEARYWCYNYLGSFPNYESFYKPDMVYKTYEIVDGGEATQTFVIPEEVTWTEYGGPSAS